MCKLHCQIVKLNIYYIKSHSTYAKNWFVFLNCSLKSIPFIQLVVLIEIELRAINAYLISFSLFLLQFLGTLLMINQIRYAFDELSKMVVKWR